MMIPRHTIPALIVSSLTLTIVILLFYFGTQSSIKSASQNEPQSKLLILAIISRHGERSPMGSFPTDPHPVTNVTEWPMGTGMLTPAGRERMWRLGQRIRRTYGDFLDGNVDIRGYSNSDQRCIDSGEEFVGGLGTADLAFTINNDILQSRGKECPTYGHTLDAAIKSVTVREEMARHEVFLRGLQNDTGLRKINLDWAERVSRILQQERDIGKQLPTWATKGTMKWLNLFADYQFCVEMRGSLANRKLLVGQFYEHLMNQLRGADKSSRKLLIYETHHSLIGALLETLGAGSMSMPAYGASLVFELREDQATGNRSVTPNYIYDTYNPGSRRLSVMGSPQMYQSLDIFSSFASNFMIPDLGKACHAAMNDIDTAQLSACSDIFMLS